MKQPIWKPFFCLLHQARLPYFYILLYTLLSISASQLYLLFPSYTQQIMQGNINQTMALMVAAVVLGQAFVKAQRPDSHSSWKRIIVALYVFWSLWDPVFLSLEAGRPGSRYDTVSVWSWSLAGKDPVFMEPEDPGKDRRAYGPPV